MTQLSEKKQEAIRLTVTLSGGLILFRALNYPLGILVAYWLGPSLLGVTAIFNLIKTYVKYNQLGMSQVLVRQIPIVIGEGDLQGKKNIIDVVTTYNIIVTTLCLFGLWAAYFAGFDFKGVMNLTRMLILTATLVFTRLESLLHSYMKGVGKFDLITKKQVIVSAVSPVMLLIMVYFWSVEGALLTYLAIHAIGILIYRPGYRDAWPKLRLPIKKFLQLLKIGLKVFLNSIANDVFLVIDSTVIAMLLTTRDVGLFGFALGAAAKSLMFTSMFEMTLFRHILVNRGAMGLSGGIEFMRKYLENPATGVVLITTVFSVFFFFVYSLVIQLFLVKYCESASCIFVLFLGQSFYVASCIPSSCMNASDQLNLRLFLTLGALALNATLDVVAIKSGYGILGASWASTFSFFIYCVVINLVIRIQVYKTLLNPLFFLFKISSISIVAFTAIHYLSILEIVPFSDTSSIYWKTLFGLFDACLKSLIVSAFCFATYFLAFHKQGLTGEFKRGAEYLFSYIKGKLRIFARA